MIQKEAHDRIDSIITKHEIDDVYVTISSFQDYDALRIARKALEQEPCEDAISRQAVLDITWEEPSYTDALNVLTEVRDKVKALPPVNPQKPKSEWQKDHEILKAYSDGANEVLDKIRDEIREQSRMHMDGDLYIKTSSCMQIINDYMAEEDKE